MRPNLRLDAFYASQLIQDYEGRDCAPWLFVTVWGLIGIGLVLFWGWVFV